MMNFWTAVVIIVAIVTFSAVYGARLNAKTEQSEKWFRNLTRRLDKLEERMANLETIVLEKEKARAYEKL